MKILVTNDDGIFAEGIWALARELKNIAGVVVVAPDGEQSGIGTALTLKKPLGIKKVNPVVPGVEAYSVEGTPADSVVLALEKIFKDEIDLVISGINPLPNMGHDVLVSGTVGAALQGYLRGLPAIAISVFPYDDKDFLDDAAKFTAVLAEKIFTNFLTAKIFLNVNIPYLPLSKIKGVKITRLSSKGYIGITEEDNDGKKSRYSLVPQKIYKGTDRTTDIWAAMEGNISITPLYTYLNNDTSSTIPDSFCSEIFEKLREM